MAFPEGCGTTPTSCWVVENYNLKTCIRDDRKCLQGECITCKGRHCPYPIISCLQGACKVSECLQGSGERMGSAFSLSFT